MRITEIKLQSIRSHRETALSLERLSTLSGLNHSGKSSIAQSIGLALCRRCDTTGAGGQGQTDLLRFGEDQGLIKLALDLDGTPVELRASLTKRSGLNVTLRNPQDKDWSPVQLAADLKADQDVLSCLCDNTFFVGMKPSDQKALLAGIVLPSTYEWPEWVKADLHNSRIQPDWDDSPFNTIECCYDKSFKARIDVNRSIRDWRAPVAGAKYDGPPVEQIREQLALRQSERMKVAVEQQRLAGDIAQAAQAEAGHKRRALEARQRITNERIERGRIADGSLSKPTVKKLETEAAGLAKAISLDTEMQSVALEIGQVMKSGEKIGIYNANGTSNPHYREPICCHVCHEEVEADIVRQVYENRNESHYWCLDCARKGTFECRRSGALYNTSTVNKVTMWNKEVWSEPSFENEGFTCAKTHLNYPNSSRVDVRTKNGVESWCDTIASKEAWMSDLTTEMYSNEFESVIYVNRYWMRSKVPPEELKNIKTFVKNGEYYDISLEGKKEEDYDVSRIPVLNAQQVYEYILSRYTQSPA